MNPFEFVIAIVVIVFGYKLLATSMRRKRESLEGHVETENADLRQRLEQLEERVRVLERIVTDERYDLKQQFKDLEA
jgi:Tfp pilus assembly protein PilO